MTSTARRSVGVFLLCALLSGPAASGCGSFGDYARDRAWDALDMVRIQGLAGVGLDVNGELTHFFGIGGGAFHAWAAGIGTRRIGVWHELCLDFDVPFAIVLSEKRTIDGDEPDRRNEFNLYDLLDQKEHPYSATENNKLQWLSARICVFAFVGIDAELRVGEALDFVVGIFGLDPAKDDKAGAPREGDNAWGSDTKSQA